MIKDELAQENIKESVALFVGVITLLILLILAFDLGYILGGR